MFLIHPAGSFFCNLQAATAISDRSLKKARSSLEVHRRRHIKIYCLLDGTTYAKKVHVKKLEWALTRQQRQRFCNRDLLSCPHCKQGTKLFVPRITSPARYHHSKCFQPTSTSTAHTNRTFQDDKFGFGFSMHLCFWDFAKHLCIQRPHAEKGLLQ